MMPTVFHACASADWQQALLAGAYFGSPQDRADGFIHFSTLQTVRASVARWLAGRDDLVLLEVESAALGEALRWEVARDGQLFPHLYAALPVERVSGVWPLPLLADGAHLFPDHIPG